MKKQFILKKDGNKIVSTFQVQLNFCRWLVGFEFGSFRRSSRKDNIHYLTLHCLPLSFSLAYVRN